MSQNALNLENYPAEPNLEETPALCFLEFSSISRGIFVTDLVLKKAPVKVLSSLPVSSGKHVVLFMGDVASVEESHREALQFSQGTLIKSILIPGVHEGLPPFLNSIWTYQTQKGQIGEALGIVESSTLASSILAADRALKMADVSLCRMRLGQGIGGKAYFVLTGRQEEVEASLEAAQRCLTELECTGRTDLIARPIEEMLDHL